MLEVCTEFSQAVLFPHISQLRVCRKLSPPGGLTRPENCGLLFGIKINDWLVFACQLQQDPRNLILNRRRQLAGGFDRVVE